MLKKLAIFGFVVIQGLLLLIVYPNMGNDLMAKGGVDINVAKENYYTSIFSTSDGDHMLRLDTSGANVVLHNYMLDQNGQIIYAGFRNLIVDYAVAGILKLSGNKASTPQDLLTTLSNGVFSKQDDYKQWRKEVEANLSKAEKNKIKKDKLHYPLLYCNSERFFKKPEKAGDVRMIIMNKNGSDDERVMVIDHTNKVYLVYELDLKIGLKLVSARRFSNDEKLADPDQSDLLLMATKQPYTSKDMAALLSKVQKSRANGKPYRTYTK